MREIEFRGKHKNPYGDKWVEGYYALLDGEHVIIMPHSTSYEKALKENKIIPTISVNHEIDINTLGQYTGLKDKNGKKIFEGDIVKFQTDDENEIYENVCEIVFEKAEFLVKNTKSVFGPTFIRIRLIKDIEVIGNIYDNPELLEEK